ncbi:DUF2158 domain-containing protein [Acinetobacter sp.]|uniref:YodC family protein n=1 Tax=Acinetobacter sp. TaxID=472 RepID=UPI00282AF5DF|nr:DUF2158 domain-containing protein [Acinetobacter sp.]MDR0238128.1 YodC family protein [Acinetobacter sp.]
MAIKAGDLVELKSGSPQMTVVEIVLGTHAILQWYENGEIKDANVGIAALKVLQPTS